jgi:hypothetical protein
MNELNEGWFINKGFIMMGDGDDLYFYKDHCDIRYIFKFRGFSNDWSFYVEYTDSPYERDNGMKYPVSFGLKTTDQVEKLWELLTLV